jgi:hypothetical protein
MPDSREWDHRILGEADLRRATRIRCTTIAISGQFFWRFGAKRQEKSVAF